MANPKQVMDMRSNKEGISTLESNEQQRNWKDGHWEFKEKDSTSNYDHTRDHLNFEVTKGGVVQPIDKTKTIDQTMRESLHARGIKNPNDRPNAKRQNRILAQFIFGGNRERMHEIAFGNQRVDLSKGADNSGIVRCPDIEEWAKDVYNFVAKKYGEENIVSFYVHLDETNPHAHCTILPVKDGKLSYRAVFGNTIHEESVSMTALHDEFVREVGNKWGLERGSNMAETKAKHRSTEEYKRNLVNDVTNLSHTVEGLRKEIQTAERKLKSFNTMLANLQKQREDILDEIGKIEEQFGMQGVDPAELAQHMDDLRKQLKDIDDTITQRQLMLDETNNVLAKANKRLAEMQAESKMLSAKIGSKQEQEITYVERNIFASYISMVSDSFAPAKPTLSYNQKVQLDQTGFNDLTENSFDVLSVALYLAKGYVAEATNYLDSYCGGSSNLSGWGRDKDDDDEMWWRKCITQSAALVKHGRRMGRRR